MSNVNKVVAEEIAEALTTKAKSDISMAMERVVYYQNEANSFLKKIEDINTKLQEDIKKYKALS